MCHFEATWWPCPRRCAPLGAEGAGASRWCVPGVRMRVYQRTQWYGFAYFLEHKGTVLPKLLPPIAVSSFISIMVTNNHRPLDWCPAEESLFYHPFILSAVSMVVGYITVARFNISCARRRESSRRSGRPRFPPVVWSCLP